ncbi:sorbosone dehydrogenase family protein [Olivibacter ginsenosidimutans]|uniref:Sorbosone dehydrogenase family protein n=1 Tax=Olivibacter ginsenosidimutans TaxID=1176537 RepID=A0ABP9C9X5_9SPHI
MQHMSNLGSLKNSSLAALFMLAVLVSCKPSAKTVVADEDNAGLTLPEGFGALKAADSVGKARHLVVNANGDIFVKLEKPKDGSGILMLSDGDGDGKVDSTAGFGNYDGTGIAMKGDYLYASSNTDVFRYKLNEHQHVIDGQKPDTVVSGLIDRRQHNSKSISLDEAGNIYVNIGAYSNACQIQDRTKGSPGMLPCPILDSAGGIWQFKAEGIKQGYADGVHYATGLRNVVGLDWNKQASALFVMQHGRDNLQDFYPELFGGPDVSVNLPAETMYEVHQGTNAGWPYFFYDQDKKQKVLNPEYESHRAALSADSIADPAVAFPGHLAPNALLFYTGNMFPEKYRNGAFIAFHGSWNRAPKQEGFFVAFVPFKNGKPNGEWEVFAKGFAGAEQVESPGDAKHRPTGLAQGPDGSLYVSDDAGGTIYRIIYGKQ